MQLSGNIDPDFLGQIEQSLISMTDYAEEYLEEIVDHAKKVALHQAIQNDINRANEVLEKISEWFEDN